jgi:hypothetical protein
MLILEGNAVYLTEIMAMPALETRDRIGLPDPLLKGRFIRGNFALLLHRSLRHQCRSDGSGYPVVRMDKDLFSQPEREGVDHRRIRGNTSLKNHTPTDGSIFDNLLQIVTYDRVSQPCTNIRDRFAAAQGVH